MVQIEDYTLVIYSQAMLSIKALQMITILGTILLSPDCLKGKGKIGWQSDMEE